MTLYYEIYYIKEKLFTTTLVKKHNINEFILLNRDNIVYIYEAKDIYNTTSSLIEYNYKQQKNLKNKFVI